MALSKRHIAAVAGAVQGINRRLTRMEERSRSRADAAEAEEQFTSHTASEQASKATDQALKTGEETDHRGAWRSHRTAARMHGREGAKYTKGGRDSHTRDPGAHLNAADNHRNAADNHGEAAELRNPEKHQALLQAHMEKGGQHPDADYANAASDASQSAKEALGYSAEAWTPPKTS